jgi:GNAT superfamily N-acetyltransferase
MATDVVKQVVELNHLSFGNGDPFNSADLVRAGIDEGTLIVLTEPRRPSEKNPVIGFSLMRIDKRCIRLERIAVHPKHRNHGYAKALLERSKRWRDANAPSVPIFTYVADVNLSSLNAFVHSDFGIEHIGGGWISVMG